MYVCPSSVLHGHLETLPWVIVSSLGKFSYDSHTQFICQLWAPPQWRTILTMSSYTVKTLQKILCYNFFNFRHICRQLCCVLLLSIWRRHDDLLYNRMHRVIRTSYYLSYACSNLSSFRNFRDFYRHFGNMAHTHGIGNFIVFS